MLIFNIMSELAKPPVIYSDALCLFLCVSRTSTANCNADEMIEGLDNSTSSSVSEFEERSSIKQGFIQEELNDLVRDFWAITVRSKKKGSTRISE